VDKRSASTSGPAARVDVEAMVEHQDSLPKLRVAGAMPQFHHGGRVLASVSERSYIKRLAMLMAARGKE
jgi:hypothetical protein